MVRFNLYKPRKIRYHYITENVYADFRSKSGAGVYNIKRNGFTGAFFIYGAANGGIYLAEKKKTENTTPVKENTTPVKEKTEAVPREAKLIIGKLKRHFGKTLKTATQEEIYKASALCIRDSITDLWLAAKEVEKEKNLKKVYYLCAEFLMGRALNNNIVNLGLWDKYKAAFDYIGIDITDIASHESDAGLGNGGLGRLSACFLDSLASLKLPAMGCGIRYEYGLFRQKIVDGEQVELEDNWMESGFIWEIEQPDDKVEVHFGGEVEEVWQKDKMVPVHKNYSTVLAVPYDVPVIGYDSKYPSTLRLWSARAKDRFNMDFFDRGEYVKSMEERELAEVISKVLYPNDNHEQGKILRLKQFYFFTSATIQHIIREHKKNHGDLHTLASYVTIQINDTHPTLAIPELMRILMDEESMTWEEAMHITKSVFNYTNHTILAEALECWDEQMFKLLLPRIYSIIQAINENYCRDLFKYYHDLDKISHMSIVAYGQIRMANLCVAVCSRVNGVSQLHGDILKSRLFNNEYRVTPMKFTAITNGITHRRWLAVANPELTSLITEYIGDQFLNDYRHFERLLDYVGDKEFLQKFAKVKQNNKERLAQYLLKTQNVVLKTDAIFDVQAKRLHEYKRQLLKCLHILYLYNKLQESPDYLTQPIVFLFAAKAAPGYARAKNVIRLINAISELIKNDPIASKLLQVIFIENYSVSNAEILIPSADLSEQISTAGLEASGTGNMKFMMNGAVTIGTMDGANVEIYHQAGAENIYIFGATDDEIDDMKRYHTYRPGELYEKNIDIRNAVTRLIDGTLSSVSSHQFSDLYQSLLFGDYNTPDEFFVLHDFVSYVRTFDNARHKYQHHNKEWVKMAAINTAKSGFFSSDRTIMEYNRDIWRLKSYDQN